jgi:hypothetical protein
MYVTPEVFCDQSFLNVEHQRSTSNGVRHYSLWNYIIYHFEHPITVKWKHTSILLQRFGSPWVVETVPIILKLVSSCPRPLNYYFFVRGQPMYRSEYRGQVIGHWVIAPAIKTLSHWLLNEVSTLGVLLGRSNMQLNAMGFPSFFEDGCPICTPCEQAL